MNLIVKNMMKKYLEKLPEIQNRKQSEQFEYFTSSLILKNFAGARSDVDVDEYIAGDGIQGYDFFAVLVNDELMADIVDLRDTLEKRENVRIKFIFGQIKSGQHKNIGPIGTFLDSVKRIIGEVGENLDQKRYPCVEHVKYVYDNADKFSVNPELSCIYVVTGKSEVGETIEEKVREFKEELDDLDVISECSVDFLGSKQIQELYRVIEQGISRKVNIPGKTPIADVPEISDGYIGLISLKELLKLITLEECDDDRFDKSRLAKSVFSENIRDYQGHVEVNNSILETLKNPEKRKRFPVLNNGVTIVSREIRPTKEQLYLKQYQILNGCQTAHVVHEFFSDLVNTSGYEEASAVVEGIHVMVKIVGTDKPDLLRAITRATNQQTRVSPENLLSNLPIQKDIEEFFDSKRYGDKSNVPLYYERRDKQWDNEHIEPGKWRVISIKHLIQAFSSCFLARPHTANRYYTDLRDMASTIVFDNELKLPYMWASSLLFCRMEFLFSNQKISSDLKPLKFHIMSSITRAFVKNKYDFGKPVNVGEKRLSHLIELASDDDLYIEAIEIAGEVAQQMKGAGKFTRQFCHTEGDARRFINKASKVIRKKMVDVE